MELVLIGIAVFFNIAVIKWKFDRGQPINAIVDAALLIGVAIVFSGSTAALIIGTIGSALVSIYLLISPVRMPNAAR